MPKNDSSEKYLSFLDHLEELRIRIFKVLLAVVVGAVVGYGIAQYPLELLLQPLLHSQKVARSRMEKKILPIEVEEDGTLKIRGWEPGKTTLQDADTVALYTPGQDTPFKMYGAGDKPSLIYLHPMDPFMIQVKAGLVIGMILAMPVILWQIWAFIAPGLYMSERKLALPLIVSGTLLFPMGAAFAYFLLDVTLQFFSHFVLQHAVVQNDAREYLGFTLTMMLSFGLVFELPLVIVLATRIGIVKVEWLAARRSYIFLILLIIAAIITPTGDPVTLMAMALPLQILFEISLIVSRLLDRLVPPGKDDPEQIEQDQDS